MSGPGWGTFELLFNNKILMALNEKTGLDMWDIPEIWTVFL